MKSSKRAPSGAKIAPHGKNDARGSHVLRGTPLTHQTRVTYRVGPGQYRTGLVERVISDAAQVSHEDSRWITRGSTVRVRSSQDLRVKIVHRERTGGLLGVKL